MFRNSLTWMICEKPQYKDCDFQNRKFQRSYLILQKPLDFQASHDLKASPYSTHNTAQTCCLAIAQYWLRTLIISCYSVEDCTINPLLPDWSGYDFKITIPGPRSANHTTNSIIQLQVCQTCSHLSWTVWHSICQPMHVTSKFVVIAFLCEISRVVLNIRRAEVTCFDADDIILCPLNWILCDNAFCKLF